MTAKSKKFPDRQPPAPEVVDLEAPEWQADFVERVRLKKARIPAFFLGKTFDSFKAQRVKERIEVLNAAKSYVSSFNFKSDAPPEGLMIEGTVGCGKTHIAVAILKEIVAKGYSGLYYNMVNLLSDIRSTYNPNSPLDESELLAEFDEPDLVVLDDLGAEKTADWVNDRLYLIVNRRYESGKPIVVTTNLSEKELIDKLGPRIVSRLCEICHRFPKFPDEDYRREHMR